MKSQKADKDKKYSNREKGEKNETSENHAKTAGGNLLLTSQIRSQLEGRKLLLFRSPYIIYIQLSVTV